MNNPNQLLIDNFGAALAGIECKVLNWTLNALKNHNANALKNHKPTRDEAVSAKIFGMYTGGYLGPCQSRGCASRAASFSTNCLIPEVLKLEQALSTQFHKGALFYDTGLAHLFAGNEDGYERFLAMADEENHLTRNKDYKRGTANLRSDGLAAQTIKMRMEFACALLNGKIAVNGANFAVMTGLAPVSATQFDAWRQKLQPLQQFELLRIIHDIEVFLGLGYPHYSPVADNPFVMLRLAKALTHLAQWVESCLTHWQEGLVVHKNHGKLEEVKTLRQKLVHDPQFGILCNRTFGGSKNFPGNIPEGVNDINRALSELLRELETKPAGVEQHCRLLRILYIVRNSTAHTIEDGLELYKDRPLLLNLLQAVFVSVFVICQLKKKPMP